ncbi:MAG TPA: nuclear transport factor 2 family protein [bacterium]|nr:nuclear transport factor 2 family protein [bacterium]
MDFATMLKEFTAAVEAGDGTRLANLFTEDGVYHDTFYGEFKGRAAIRDMLEQRFWGDATAFKWDAFDGVSDSRLGYCCWNFSYTSSQTGSAGKRVVAEGMSRFRLRDGLIEHYGEKFDSGMALVQMDFAPERLTKLLRRWNDGLREKPALRAHFAG